jgi:hydroxymethylglutaryl-CoA reductase
MNRKIQGFSKLSKKAKMEWLAKVHLNNPEKGIHLMNSYMHNDILIQKKHDEFIENTVANYFLPLGVAPNFLINEELYTIPMAIEESSVVAAASKSAKFWISRGGFKSHVISSKKIGHIHFTFDGDQKEIFNLFTTIKKDLISATSVLTKNMRNRGGGILDVNLIDKTDELIHYYQLEVKFETCDSMGANFINSCLEEMSKYFLESAENQFENSTSKLDIIMSILSNYTPECLVHCEVTCPVSDLIDGPNFSSEEFAKKFKLAVDIAKIEPYRAATHNKGIMNGIDAVILATGNDFRAVEAACHTYASKDGQYKSLTHCDIKDGIFKFWIEIPLSLGTVGGLTKLHPMVQLSLDVLGSPDAHQLMKIVAASGLAQNFAALRALTTTGIQKGHMKMHLLNILNQLGASDIEKEILQRIFSKSAPHHAEVVNAFNELRSSSKSKIESE